jgi:glutathione S-transferase
MKLYGFKFSSCTRRVAVICKELNVEYSLIPIDLTKGEQRSAANLARQPFGLVPTIEVLSMLPGLPSRLFSYRIQDNGLELFESRAIGRYLVAKYGRGSGLVPDPTDIEASAKFEQAASIENNNFDPTAGQLALELILKPSVYFY